MISRIRKSMQEKDQGFTLIELLVVIIIIGILAAIAIPLFLNQRKKAVDTAARSDVSTIGKEVATWFVDQTAMPVIAVAGTGTAAKYQIGTTAAKTDIGRKSNNVTFNKISGTDSTNWCVQVDVTAGQGTLTSVSYSAAAGLLDNGLC